MGIPQAVAANIKTPGVYLLVDLIAGVSSPGTGLLRVALLASKSSAGDLTTNTEVRTLAGADSGGVAFGPGTEGHLTAKMIYRKYPGAVVDAIAPLAGTTAADLDITFASTPTSDNVVLCDIMGRTFQIAWLTSETADVLKAKIIAKVGELGDDLAVAAISGGVGIVTLTAKVPGNIGEDIRVAMSLQEGSTGTETINGGTSIDLVLLGGSTDGDFSTALAALSGKEYHYIVAVCGNVDMANVATSNNLDKLFAHITGLDTGLNAKLQQGIVGFTGTLAAALASTPHANSGNNSEKLQFVWCEKGRGLPGELGGRECGGRLAGVSRDPAVNRIDELMDGYIGAVDKIADKPSQPELEQALNGGVTPISYTAQDSEYLVRPITCHSQNSLGAPDARVLDVQNVDATYIIARDLRDNMPLEFPNAKITKDVAPGAEPPPRGVIEERDIKGWTISRLRFWQRQGVATKASIDAAIANGSLIVQVNESDATQVDLVVPFKIVPPLAKFGLVVQRQPN